MWKDICGVVPDLHEGGDVQSMVHPAVPGPRQPVPVLFREDASSGAVPVQVNVGVRSATITTACASVASVFRALPVSKTRTRAAS